MTLDCWGAPASQTVHESDGEEHLLHSVNSKKPRIKAKASKKSKLKGFQTMGFSEPVCEGIMRAGYQNPTPIQRAAIPVIKSGQDVVAMARTGSGKTACFLLPMFEALRTHSTCGGARALILEPTRELAEQTLRFAVKLGKFTGLHCALVVGGDSLDQQFDALHRHPDIIIATPGRLMHVCVEMNLRLDSIQYAVFDEADRLFELGFKEQLEEILARLAPTRQTLLFSATLPQLLADFAKAGLQNPTMIRLDKDEKLSEQLKLGFFSVAPAFKLHLLLFLLRHQVRADEQVIVFAATQLHVQYIELVLRKLGMSCTFLYSDMDPTSRRINAAKFQKRIVNVLVATDIAARGIDIPNLDYVINYNFPGSAKVFVHRVGRAARAGRSGTALSFVSAAEEPYLWDLHKFLGRPVLFSPMLGSGPLSRPLKLHMEPEGSFKRVSSTRNDQEQNNSDNILSKTEKKNKSEDDWSFQFGNVPDDIVTEESPQIDRLHSDCEVDDLNHKKDNAYKLYEKSLPAASKEALREMKEMRLLVTPGIHPLLRQCVQLALRRTGEDTDERTRLLELLKGLRPKKTIFELGSSGSKASCRNMQLKRKRDDPFIAKFQEALQEKRAKYQQLQELKQQPIQLPEADENDVLYDFPRVCSARDGIQQALLIKEKQAQEREVQELRQQQRQAKKQEKLEIKFGKGGRGKKKKRMRGVADGVKREEEKTDYFIPYQPADVHSERGYSVGDNFARASSAAQLELSQDHRTGLLRQRRMGRQGQGGPKPGEKRIKTESGRIIRASYKKDFYVSWLKRNRVEQENLEAAGGEQIEQEDRTATDGRFQVLSRRPSSKVHPLLKKQPPKQVREEVRDDRQVKKHIKMQKKYKEDRERGHGMKRIRLKMQGIKTKPRKKSKKTTRGKS